MVDFRILDKTIINDPMFDLIPGKHGHVLDENVKQSYDCIGIEEKNGVKMTVPLLNITPEILHMIANFIDDMDGTVSHPNVTIIIKEANKEFNVLAKIGVFSLEEELK